MHRDDNIAYGTVFIWAYAWILFKHISEGGFARQYPSIIATAIACLVLLAFSVGRIAYKKVV